MIHETEWQQLRKCSIASAMREYYQDHEKMTQLQADFDAKKRTISSYCTTFGNTEPIHKL